MTEGVFVDHGVDRVHAPSILTGPIPDYLKIYYELLGLRYIPVFKDGDIYYVLSDEASDICDRYGLLLSRRLQLPQIVPKTRVSFDLRLYDFYYSLSPQHYTVFELHSLKYFSADYGGSRIWVHEGSAESVCRRFATSANGKPTPSTIRIRLNSVRLPEYSLGMSAETRAYYELLGVEFAQIRVGSLLYTVPSGYIDLAADHLKAYLF